ncbi:MAG TPA: F0F1 ATP synthase subunit A [Planctomicrobium sp.]|nr:F0F1 ATP synthase subunit A [Planctomicrobium sp.]
MNITPDTIVYWQSGGITLHATLVFTWLVMLILVVGSWLITRNLSTGTSLSRGQNLLEILIDGIQSQIEEVTQQNPRRYLPFIGTLFLFIVTCNSLMIIPGFQPPTGSLSTTAALALCVFVAVPSFGIASRGIKAYLNDYQQPSPFMLPFNVMGEVTRTVALAIRLFGNMMSGTMIAATVLAIAPFLFPIFMNVLGLLIGVIQAYIFSILALVFIASATRSHEELLAAGATPVEVTHTESTHTKTTDPEDGDRS